MTLFQQKEFKELAAERSEYCISIYVPTQRVGENKESRLTLKNSVSAVEKQLTGMGLKKTEIEEYLEPIRKIVDDTSIWRLLSETMVIFKSKSHYSVRNLPINTGEFVHVSNRFYLLPLLDLFNQDNRYFIFLLSLKKNKLYEASQHEIVEVETNGVFPADLYDSAGHDVVQRSLETRSRIPGKEFVPFHGKGEGKNYKETEVMKYMEDIDDGLKSLFEGYEAPVVVAAVENVFAQLREVSTLKNLYPKCIAGNYDHEDALLIHSKANELLVPYFNGIRNEKKEKYLEAPDNKIISDTQNVIRAAYMGQVETLFVEKGRTIWGDFDEASGEVNIRKEKKLPDNCLIELAARFVFLKGGSVFIEEIGEMPESGSPLNAVLRFQIQEETI